jgi:hypothetical protein
MDFNYTLKYKTFDELLNEVLIDFSNFNLEGMIEPHTLIKVVKRVTYDLGLRINQTKEVLLEVSHGKAKLPDDFFTFNFGTICADVTVYEGNNISGTHIEEIPYTETPLVIDNCVNSEIIPPRTFINCKGEEYEVIQVLKTGTTRKYSKLIPLKMIPSQSIECGCPNLYVNSTYEASIKNGFLYTNFEEGKVYLNYQGSLENEQGDILVPDHDLLNEYYEYALKQRILENLLMQGENVTAQIQIIEQRYRIARINAKSLVNTPNFSELEDLWKANRKAMYSKYYDMFGSRAYSRDYKI